MKKRTFSIAFKKEVIAYMEQGHSCYGAMKHFDERDRYNYSQSMFQQWFLNREKIKSQAPSMLRASGGGRKALLGSLEEILMDEIIELRIMKTKVTRSFISDRAVSLAQQHNILLQATGNWVTGFMQRHGLSLRRTTNFTTLTNDVLISRAVSYMNFLQNIIPTVDLSKTLMMDETAVYFEDNRTQTVDIMGRRHVIMKSTGFSSMRITVVLSVWANGSKAKPLVIHKGSDTKVVKKEENVFSITQSRAWVNQELILAWIDLMFPLFDMSPGKCIIWDSCRAHIAEKVKDHCRKRDILQVVIPGGLTPYLQAGDIGIYREFKDKVSSSINVWKYSDNLEYTRGGNPKPPSHQVVNMWVNNAWKELRQANIVNSVNSAGISQNLEDWHIAKHDIYGNQFREKYLEVQSISTGHNSSDAVLDSDVYEVFDV